MDLSLLITTHQRAGLLRQSLDRLFDLTLPAELIVVDDGGDDDTQKVVDDFGACTGIHTTYIYTHNPGVQLCAHARNVGVKAARHDLVVTSEPEVCFRTDVLAQLADLHVDYSEKVISSGRIWFAPEGEAPVFDQDPPGWQVADRWTAPHIALWHRSWLMAIGGWDESFPGPWGWDDTDLLTRLRISGHGQHIAPEVEGVHLFHGLGGDAGSQNEHHFRAKSFNHDPDDLTDLVANKEREWGVPKPRP
jgi:glycosyltransferase involved in cell wall biosynthesis